MLLSADAIEYEVKDLDDWFYKDNYIFKKFVFADFGECLSKMVHIGIEVEKMNHHPEWCNVYNRLEIKLSTHDAGGVTNLDIELAKRIEEIIK